MTTPNSRSLIRQGPIETYKLHIPEHGHRRPFVSSLPCPERIYVAWHKDSKGIFDLLDENGHDKYGSAPQEHLWQVRTYQREIYDRDGREAFYEEVTGDA